MQIADGIHRVDCPLGERFVALYLLAGDDATLLVDTGVAGSVIGTLLPYMKAHGLPAESVRYVLNTHCDFDHVGGNREAREAFPNAAMLCHRLDQQMTEDVEATIAGRYGQFIAAHGYDDTPDDAKTYIRSVTGSVPVDLAVSGGECLRLGGDWAVEIMHTPGHSAGSVSVWDPRSALLIIGDAVLGDGLLTTDGRPAFPPTYRDVEPYRATIERQLGIGIAALGTAHFPLYTGAQVGDFLRLSRGYADRVESAILDALAGAPGGLTTREIIARAHDQLGPWDPGTALALFYPVVGHLESLAAQGQVTAQAAAPYVRWSGGR
jgi:glyoxylase-like metal-dependent hydrolase (beta-lactamase superfamily II)